MKKHPSLTLLVAAATLLAAGCSNTTAQTSGTSSSTQTGSGTASANVTKTSGNVSVTFVDPERFTDCRSSFNSMYDDGYLDLLSGEIARTASRYLEDGQKLDVTVTDVDLAGDFNPSRSQGNDVRIVKEIYRPRITLNFKLTGADGKVIKEGDRTLADSYFMNNVLTVNRDDPLYYDKAMLNTWVKDEFRK